MGSLAWRDRAVWLGAGLGAAGVLVLARVLEASAAGHGTHTQLGLPPCGFYSLTGVPCPACGLTTSFVHLMHGNWVGAALANPVGVPLCLLTLAALPLSAWGLLRGASVLTMCRRLGLSTLLSLCGAALFAAWFTRLFVVIFG